MELPPSIPPQLFLRVLSDIGIYPGVTVRSTPDASTASLFADDFCGAGTSLIYYVKPDSVLSRTFTSKDTHSTMGDLLVVYSDSRLCYSDSALARQTNAIIGLEAPTFTCGTDLILPVGVNAGLREALASDKDMLEGDDYEMAADVRNKMREINDISAIPQVRESWSFYTSLFFLKTRFAPAEKRLPPT